MSQNDALINEQSAAEQAKEPPGSDIEREIDRRRTFAIISHPDAGKTTLTEKLLLFGGAIQLSGQVKAKKDRQSTRSDWMAIEKARGISVATSVMTFAYRDTVFNLLDTPGHEDFSDHTYRTLTAVDAAVMVIDAARGIEARTRKLFEICRLRDIPIITFVNKLDRESRDPFEILDEIEQQLALETAPMVWPIGMGQSFRGTYDLRTPRLRQLDKTDDGMPVSGPDDPVFDTLLDESDVENWRETVELVNGACHTFNLSQFLEGTRAPGYCGSAIKNFGVRDLLDALIAFAPPPGTQKSQARLIRPAETKMTGLVFKIQANMDRQHRDRIAFVRVCSGRLSRGMKVKVVRTGKTLSLQAPQFFFAQDRSIAEHAFAGDVVGVPNKGGLRIGDALTEGEDVRFVGIPDFAPEILRRVKLEDAMKAKKLKDALQEMAEEGAVQLFAPIDGRQPIVGVIGALQLDVLSDRLMHEYALPISFETTSYTTVRWIGCDDPKMLKAFTDKNRNAIAEDLDGDTVYMAKSDFDLKWASDHNRDIRFTDVKM